MRFSQTSAFHKSRLSDPAVKKEIAAIQRTERETKPKSIIVDSHISQGNSYNYDTTSPTNPPSQLEVEPNYMKIENENNSVYLSNLGESRL